MQHIDATLARSIIEMELIAKKKQKMVLNINIVSYFINILFLAK